MYLFSDITEKFFSSIGQQNIDTADIHVVTSCLKNFLRSLSEPIIPIPVLNDLIQLIKQDQHLTVENMPKILTYLPQPNRDTLACIILYFQKLASIQGCEVTAENLVKIFGPIFFTYNVNNETITYTSNFVKLDLEIVLLNIIKTLMPFGRI